MSGEPRRIDLTYTGASSAVRLDVFAAAQAADLTRSRVARLIRAGRVTVNGAPAPASRRLRHGDTVCIETPPDRAELKPEPGPLARVLATDDFVVIDKPAGLVMHPGAGTASGTLAHRLLAHFPEMRAVGHPRRPGIVHRLDKDTSGVVAAARTPAAYAHLAREFEQRRVGKRYLLIVKGTPSAPRGRIDAAIGRHPAKRTRMAVARRGRPAQTDYQVLARGAGASLLDARPETGRTHQIRVHAAAIGHPILGDAAYGGEAPGAARPLLHAWTLTFFDPAGQRWLAAAAPPEDFQQAAARLGLPVPETPPSGPLTPGGE